VVGRDHRTDLVISTSTTFKLKIEKTSGGFVYTSFTVKVK